MDLNTIENYKSMGKFAQFKGYDTISLDVFFQLLDKAESLHNDNQRLYSMLNSISEVIENSR